MCGIAGFVDYNRKSSKEVLIKMTDTLIHRGPDGAGYECFNEDRAIVGLGHRRLSIIDLSSGGHQPMEREDLWITYNGEIYNYIEIKRELKSLGHSFTSGSDTEMILLAYRQWGMDCVSRFRGMFSFCLFDRRRQVVTLCRDRLGVKPLFLYEKDGLLLFGSELKVMHAHPSFDKEVNHNSVALYFRYGYVPSPDCIFQNTVKVSPGTYIEIDLTLQSQKTISYWDAAHFTENKNTKCEKEIQDDIEKIIVESCEYRMVADVPVGTFLSGGYDSSLVTAILQRGRTDKVKTFTIGFEDPSYDESKYAKAVSDYLQTDHTSYICTKSEALDIIPDLSYYYDEPFADSSAIPTSLVSKITSQSVKVALSADGGDEVFGGYNRNTRFVEIQRKLLKVPSVLRSVAGGSLSMLSNEFLFSHGQVTKMMHGAQMIKDPDLLTIANLYPRNMSDMEIIRLIGGDSISDPKSALINKLSSISDRLNAVLTYDYISTLTNDMLVKVDRAAMAYHLEGREPLLDHHIYEYMAGVPSAYKIKNGNLKHILKSITHKYVPREIMERPKMGFGIPIHQWMRSDLKEYVYDTLSERSIKEAGILDSQFVFKNLPRYMEGPAHLNRLWLLVQFQSWYNQWM